MSIENRIEEVLLAHPFADGCSWCSDAAEAYAPECCRGLGETNHAAHVAAAVIQALGLKQEASSYEKFETKSESGGEGNMRWGGQTSRSLGWRTSTRLVSEWVEQ